MFEVKPIAAALGAELHGVDLCQDLSEEVYAEIRRLLVEYQVIFLETKIYPQLNTKHLLSLSDQFKPILHMKQLMDFQKLLY